MTGKKEVSMWKKQISLATFGGLLVVGLLVVIRFSAIAAAEEIGWDRQSMLAGEGETAGIWLEYDGNTMPDYNDEITVYVHSDPLLLAMDTIIQISGDANFTTAMSEADVNEYGWDNGWNSDYYIDPEGWLLIDGVSWDCTANGTIGYFKFRYYSGQVVLSISGDSEAADANCEIVLFSGQPLIFGSDPNQSLVLDGNTIDSNSASELPSQDLNDSNSQNVPDEPPVSGGTTTNNATPQDINDSNNITYTLPPFASEPNKTLINAAHCDLIDSDYVGIVKTGESYNLENNLPLSGNNLVLGGFSVDSGQSIVEIYDDITINQIWTANNIYHINVPINVQALLVIEPGTQIIFGNDGGYYDCAIYVNSGGTLISVGTPDNPIIYTSDSASPDFSDYYYSIYIEETASSSTKVTYSYFKYAYAGILIDNNRLDSPIENNYFYYNTYGIIEVGTALTDIQNNLLYYSDQAAIDVNMASDTGQGSADTSILIANNTCDSYQSFGIIVRGVANSSDAGYDTLLNNIVSRSYYYGLALVNGYMFYTLTNTGYYGNPSGGNTYDTYIETRPVIETTMPYLTGAGTIPYFYLKPNSSFVNESDQYIKQTHLIGKTTDVNGIPDTNKVNLGFHYPNWDFSNAGDVNGLTMDLNHDLIVNFKDLAILKSGWRTTYNFYDLKTMADEWLDGPEPNIQIQISGDPNMGSIDIGVNGHSPETQRIFLLANGAFVREMFRFKNGTPLTIDISGFGNGQQQFKAISIDSNSNITCSNIQSVTFSNPFTYCSLPKHYEPNQPLYFAGFHNRTGNVSFNVYANGGTSVWSQTFSGNNIFGAIPAAITQQYEFDYVSFTETSSGMSDADLETSASSGGGASVSEIIDPAGPPLSWNVQALIVLPNWYIRLHDYQMVWAARNAFKGNGVICATLSGSDATYDNVTWYARNKNIKYLYIACTDGHYAVDPGNPSNYWRTNLDLYDATVVSIKRSDYTDPNMAPTWCTKLDYWENEVKSFAVMGFTNLEFAYFDCCYSGRLKINSSNQLVQCAPGQQGLLSMYQSDMSFALGMSSGYSDCAYQGWYDLVSSKFPPNETEYQRWSRLEWYGLEDRTNLYDALIYVIGQQYYFGTYDPVNCYRLSGMGDLTNICLGN
jgi:hypothetical protein